MIMICQTSVVLLLVATAFASNDGYSRELVQKEYPGFGTDYLIFLDENNEEARAYLPKRLRLLGLDDIFKNDFSVEESVTFTLYTRDLLSGKAIKSVADLGTEFVNTKKTNFVTHGYSSSGKSDSCITIKDNYLNKSDVNVFIMDWSPISKILWYDIPKSATRDVGRVYSTFINQLIATKQVDPKTIHLIGHSLGAHISGFAARLVDGKVGRVTGLDPAFPGFEFRSESRLNDKDADFVDVIHTCAGLLGIPTPIGHVDFYPNGGNVPQPGCNVLQLAEGCSHGRSWELFAHSINNTEPFVATSCRNFVTFTARHCHGDRVVMGEQTPNTARGIYLLETTGTSPFVKSVFAPIIDNHL